MKNKLNDDDYFFNSNGLIVMTKEYLLERGYCCGNGCINCPYDYKNVPEPRRAALLEKRKAASNSTKNISSIDQ
ncbi:MAG: DUF5522 domain-containing protein [Chitinophagaceae bacterium]